MVKIKKGGDSLNPSDAFRKQLKKKEIEKNRKERSFNRRVTFSGKHCELSKASIPPSKHPHPSGSSLSSLLLIYTLN